MLVRSNKEISVCFPYVNGIAFIARKMVKNSNIINVPAVYPNYINPVNIPE